MDLRLEAGKLLAHSESSDRAIEKAARAIDGQTLTSVDVDPDTGGSRFAFELGTTLRTSPLDEEPSDKDYESWLLYTPDSRVFRYRDDGCYSWHSADTAAGDEVWLPTPAGARAQP